MADVNTVIVLSILFLFVMATMSHKTEGFHIGEPRYGLRGDLLKTSDIRYKYIYPENHFRIDKSPGIMYESRNPPHLNEGNCKPVSCPHIFGRSDGVCWDCDGHTYTRPPQDKKCKQHMRYEYLYPS
tara:strand:- start:23547 stop:23927 length:381 start_codon:yes stop_codon:yes gene_type:complete